MVFTEVGVKGDKEIRGKDSFGSPGPTKRKAGSFSPF